MNNVISYQLKNNEYKNIKNFFETYRQDHENQYVLDVYDYQGFKITIYNSLKMVIQGKNLNEIVTLFNCQFGIDLNVKNESNKLIDNQIDQAYIIGCDEVGVGDFFGGLVTACVYLNQEDLLKAQLLKINDSKQLDDQKILEIYPLLIKDFQYATASFSPSEYNKFYEEHPNNHLIKTYLHNKALSRLITKIKPPYKIVMDAYVSKQKYEQYLVQLNIKNPIKVDYFVPKAENKFLAVGMASMIARATFLIQMNKLNKKLNLFLPLGVNYEKIYEASFFVLGKYGINIFNKLVKKHFKTYNLVLDEYEKKNKQ